ncbi:uncharacterized protein [Prorops nasuta]|uniref:uncharacterized protein n=1 Tax=Prorops nasuta TaxID=863751 RepID=UPI0034CE0C68
MSLRHIRYKKVSETLILNSSVPKNIAIMKPLISFMLIVVLLAVIIGSNSKAEARPEAEPINWSMIYEIAQGAVMAIEKVIETYRYVMDIITDTRDRVQATKTPAPADAE